MTQNKCLTIWLFMICILALWGGPIEADVIYHTENAAISPWHIYHSKNDFSAAQPGPAMLTITKTKPHKKFNSGFVVLNGKTISLHSFLRSKNLVLKKKIELKRANRFTIFLIGHPGAAATFVFSSDSVTAPLPSVVLSALPPSIKLGESATLTWESTNALSCTIEPQIGSVTTNGSIAVSPQETTLYTITATGPGGTATAQALVTIYPLPTATLSVSPTIIRQGERTTLIWQTNNADTVDIEPDIGIVDLSGSMEVGPHQDTTYTLTATGPGGMVQSQAMITVNPAITLNIQSPLPGDTISSPFVMVRGTFNNASGNETGISVNGIPALIEGNQFVANQVPLQQGDNTIMVQAVDVKGQTAETDISVIAETNAPRIQINLTAQSGIAPFETVLSILAPFGLQESSVTVDGPGQASVYQTDIDRYALQMSTPGFYTVLIQATDNQNMAYSDSIVVQALDRIALDVLLQAKWHAMKTFLSSGDVTNATSLFSEGTKDSFQYNFELLQDHLQTVVDGMQEISLIDASDHLAEYNFEGVQNGQRFSFILMFEKGADGIWRIKFF